jgi:branched-chain amino acid transport system permease protein
MPDPALLVELTIAGITTGLLFGLIAVGFTAVYNSSGVLNFGQGAFVMVGGMLTYELIATAGLPLVVAAVGAMAATSAIGVLAYLGLAAPLTRRGAQLNTIMIATLGVQEILENGALRLFGSQPVSFPAFTSGPPIVLGPAVISQTTIWIFVGSVGALVCLNYVFLHTGVGSAARAAAFDPVAARLVGISVSRMALVAWAFSGALGALAGILYTPAQGMSFAGGSLFVFTALAAAIMGGLGNATGAIVAGVFLGLVESWSVLVFPTTAQAIVGFVALLLVILIRPQGFFQPLVSQELH